MQHNQPTHFIEAWATKDEYKSPHLIKHCTTTTPLPIEVLGTVLSETKGSIHTVAIFKIYPKNQS